MRYYIEKGSTVIHKKVKLAALAQAIKNRTPEELESLKKWGITK